ncbi:DUF3343 domain-containing protein [Ferrimonas lipolytica]|uniref:DUF3343 domain-containing protein n=1 Tax=Ferrimonas lipolytica TaxID=2724191 RepID=A0A6H1UAA8_9GAMM|nr:DUF3343 domain-containing protein [Ferrimonas lipolytica]QIZ75569.1 DUF3343 domain-containing protein [Ferrimonas lipolytica]
MTLKNNTALTDCIITFASGHLALQAEQALINAGKTPRLITAPRAISSECGFCLLLPRCNGSKLAAALTLLTIQHSNIYQRYTLNGVRHYAQQH